jgi:hypothetical protein
MPERYPLRIEQIRNRRAEGSFLTFPDGLIVIRLEFPLTVFLQVEYRVGGSEIYLSDVRLIYNIPDNLKKKGIGTELVHQFFAMIQRLRQTDSRFENVHLVKCGFVSLAGLNLMRKALEDQPPEAMSIFLHLGDNEEYIIDIETAREKTIEWSTFMEKAEAEGRVDSYEPGFNVNSEISLDLIDASAWTVPKWTEELSDYPTE